MQSTRYIKREKQWKHRATLHEWCNFSVETKVALSFLIITQYCFGSFNFYNFMILYCFWCPFAHIVCVCEYMYIWSYGRLSLTMLFKKNSSLHTTYIVPTNLSVSIVYWLFLFKISIFVEIQFFSNYSANGIYSGHSFQVVNILWQSMLQSCDTQSSLSWMRCGEHRIGNKRDGTSCTYEIGATRRHIRNNVETVICLAFTIGLCRFSIWPDAFDTLHTKSMCWSEILSDTPKISESVFVSVVPFSSLRSNICEKNSVTFALCVWNLNCFR